MPPDFCSSQMQNEGGLFPVDLPLLWKSVKERNDTFIIKLILSPELSAAHTRWGPAKEKPRPRCLREAASSIEENDGMFK